MHTSPVQMENIVNYVEVSACSTCLLLCVENMFGLFACYSVQGWLSFFSVLHFKIHHENSEAKLFCHYYYCYFAISRVTLLANRLSHCFGWLQLQTMCFSKQLWKKETYETLQTPWDNPCTKGHCFPLKCLMCFPSPVVSWIIKQVLQPRGFFTGF